jgi:hypothetical protein
MNFKKYIGNQHNAKIVYHSEKKNFEILSHREMIVCNGQKEKRNPGNQTDDKIKNKKFYKGSESY